MDRPTPPSDPRAAQLHRRPVPELPSLHQIVLPTPWDVGPVQIYLVEGDPVTLIDTGVRSSLSRSGLEWACESLGIALDEIRRVVLTHWHADHMGQVETLRRAGADLEVFVHEADAPYVEDFFGARERNIDATDALFREYGVPEDLLRRQREWRLRLLRDEPPLCEPSRVDHRLRGGERMAFKDFELEVLHAPGHTAGHVLLHERETGTLVTGDHVMGAAVPFTDTYYVEGEAPDPRDPLCRRPRFRGLPAYLETLGALRRQRFRTLLPAHGGVIDRPARAFHEAELFYEVRIQRVERALGRLQAAGRSPTAWEIWQALFPRADVVTAMRTRMLMVIGILDVLEAQGTARLGRRASGVLFCQRP